MQTKRSARQPTSWSARTFGVTPEHHATHEPALFASTRRTAANPTGATPVTAHTDPRGSPRAKPDVRNAWPTDAGTGTERSRFSTARDNEVT